MKFTHQSPLVILCLIFTVITLFSCSKDSDLMADYVALDPDIGTIAKFVANDSYLISISDNQEDDTFEIIVNNTESSETSAGGSNGTTVNDSYQISSNVSIILDVLANDTFENKEEVSIFETSQPNNGTVVINEDNTLTYTPEEILAAEPVTDTFTYTAEVQNKDGTVTSGEADVNIIIEVADNASRQDAVINISPWNYCQDGNPIGGGPGYDAIVTTGTHIVSTDIGWAAFKALVEARSSGDVVFINSNVTINLTGLGASTILVPAGVTIASDRGHNGSEGALLYTNEMKYNNSGFDRPVFIADGVGIRITGFTLRGPFGFSGTYASSPELMHVRRLKHGISANYDNAEVDNMHIYNFPASATGFGRMASNSTFFGPLQFSTGHKVHHNYMHNNLQNGMGYGVATDNAEVKIYGNMFHSHRHDIAGSGRSTNSYEAYCNTIIKEFPAGIGFVLNGDVGDKIYDVLTDGSGNTISYNPNQNGNTHHNFDMHPEYYCDNNVWVQGQCDPPSGDKLYIHHNDFQDDGSARHSLTNKQNIWLNGLPRSYARFEYNVFAHPHESTWDPGNDGVHVAIKQGRTIPPLPKGNVTLLGNVVNGGD